MNALVTDVLPSNLFLWPYVYWGIVGALLLSGAALAVWIRLPASGTDEISLDLYETASLGARPGATATAIVHLVLLGAVRLNLRTNRLEVSGPVPDGSHPVEDEVYRSVAAGGVTTRTLTVSEVCEARLQSLGLYPGWIGKALGLAAVVGTMALAFTLFFIAADRHQHASPSSLGATHDRRVQGAVFCCVLATVVMGFAGLGLGMGLGRERTRRGRTVFVRLRRQHPLRTTDDLPLVVALYGLDPLAARGHTALKDYLDPPPTPDPNAPVT